jgi:hypothetical protein
VPESSEQVKLLNYLENIPGDRVMPFCRDWVVAHYLIALTQMAKN